jgi:NADPH-dependent 2,4-dienoyl-CoA reductase/sulfur reductase-like enzyme
MVDTLATDILIVGGGPAGLAAAVELRRLGAGRVLVVDREKDAGGIPRHSNHVGFGIRDLYRFMTGPAYAARYVKLAEKHGVDIQTETTVTGWQDGAHLTATSPRGITALEAKAVLLATGCRERPRAARLIPGSRPAGVLTTGALQNFVYLHHERVGKRAVVVGADHVGFSAVMTLKHAGADVLALVTDLPRHQSYFQYKLVITDRYRVPIYTNTRVSCIMGKRRLEALELTNVVDGSVRQIECDTVVFTGGWIPDYELAFYGGVDIDPKLKGPRVNQRLQTSVKGVFAAGNVIHAAETADVAALSGRYAARSIISYVETGAWHSAALPIETAEPLEWVSPSVITPGETAAPNGQFTLRVSRVVERGELMVWQGERCLWRKAQRQLVPNLPVSIPDGWLAQVDAAGGPIRILLS